MHRTSDDRARVFHALGAAVLRRRLSQAAAACLVLLLGACVPPKPIVPGPAAPGAPETPVAPSAVTWREWGAPAFDAARAERRPVLLFLSRRFEARDIGAWAAIQAEAMTVAGWASRAVLVRADVDENPELADFAELSATVLQQQRVFPMAVLLTPEGIPLGVVADDASVARIEGLVAAHTPLPAIRAADSPTLDALRRAQRSAPAARPLTREAAVSRAQALAGFRDASLPSLLLLVEAGERLHAAPARDAAGRALDAWRKRAAAGTETLSSAAWRLLLHARMAEGAQGPDADAAREILAWLDKNGLEDAGLFRAGVHVTSTAAPAVDPRVFTSANAVLVGGLAAAGMRLSRPADVARAGRGAEALLARLGPAVSLRRGLDGERPLGPARLDDHAALVLGLLQLNEATGDRRWLAEAEAVAGAAVSAFWDNTGGGFFLHAEPIAPLPVRMKSGYDGERPSGNALMALALDELARRTGRADHRELARRTVEAFAGDLQQAPAGLDGLWAAALRVLPAAPTPAPTARPSAPSRIVQGAITLEARAERATLRRGERGQIRIDLAFAPGWTVTPHQASDRGEVPLSATLLEPELGAGVAAYTAASANGATAQVPLRVPADAGLGARGVRVAVRFVACRASGACEPPARVILEVPITVAP